MKLLTTTWLVPLALVAGFAHAQDAAQAPAAPAAPEATAQAPATPVTEDTVIATVNGVDITAGHLALMRAQLPQQYQQLPDAALYQALIEQAISQELLAQTVDEMGKTAELALENEARVIRANIAMTKTAEAAATDDALKSAYDTQYANAQPTTEYHAAHILVQTEDEAKAIKADLDKGGDFAAIAKEKSTDKGSAANGGDLGWFGVGMMVKPFEDAVVAAPVGKVVGPIKTDFGYHLILVSETRAAKQPTLADLHDELASEIQQKAVEAKVDELTKAAKIEKPGEALDPALLTKTELLDK